MRANIYERGNNMTNIEYCKFRQHILNHMENSLEELKNIIKIYKSLKETNGTLWGAVNAMCKYNVFDVYYGDVMETLKNVYGDKFDESKYLTEDGQYRVKNNETYCWKVYKAKIFKTIEIMEKKGEL